MSTPDIPASGATPGPGGPTSAGKKLDSWGEIASYLGREVRTVQRWERTESLPVHRHEHKKKSTVYAYAGELDAWIKQRQPKDDPEADAAFAREQELSGTDSPIDVVEPPPAPAPSPDIVRAPAVGKRVVIAIFALGALCAVSLGVYRWMQSRVVVNDKIRLVVLPFKNLSGDSTQDYISAGLTEEITTQLGRIDPQDLSVIAPTSAKLVSQEAITQIGQQLYVKYVLEGSVQSVGSKIRIDVRLIETSDASYAWTQSFTRELSDFLQAESDVADTVGRQMLTALPAPPTSKARGPSPSIGSAPSSGIVHASSPEIAKSRDDYLRGRFTWGSRGDLAGSITFFEEAIHEDPSYAEAYAGLAGAIALLGQVPLDGMSPREAKPKARDAAQRAMQLNPRLAEAHAVLGNVAMSYDWDLVTAEKELRTAIELDPNDPTPHEWYCHLLIVEGHNSDALTEARHALDLDPVSPIFHAVLAETYYYGKAYDAAIEEARQVVKLNPGFLYANFWLGSAYREKKMYPQALETFQQARQLSGDNPAMLMAYAHTQALAGNAAEARSVLQKLRQLAATRYVPSLYSAAIHVGLGEKDEAFRGLELAYEERVDRLVYLNVDPIADPLRSDPRFTQLMAKVGFH